MEFIIFENRCNTKDLDAMNGSFVDALSLTGRRGSLGLSTERLHEVYRNCVKNIKTSCTLSPTGCLCQIKAFF